MKTEGRTLTPETNGYDRLHDLKAFDDTKSGVKGLVDAGITKLPPIFIYPAQANWAHTSNQAQHDKFPIVDLDGLDEDPVKRQKIVAQVRDGAASWGFFQVVNHGIPDAVVAEMIHGARRFFEQDDEIKKRYYTRDSSRPVMYHSNIELYGAREIGWRDSILCRVAPNPPPLEELPEACGKIMLDYSKKAGELGCTLLKVLSEGLGLSSGRLLDLECGEGLVMFCHYYPPCPEPDRAIGTREHSDSSFITVLAQDDVGGLQVLHDGHWVDVPPTPGALVVNIGDALQMISNGKLKSVEHRVVANRGGAGAGARVSVATFFTTGLQSYVKLYGPLDELVSNDDPPKYRAFTLKECTQSYIKKLAGGDPPLKHFKL